MGPASYLVMLGFVIIASGWLEWAFSLRVLRNPKKLLVTVGLATPPFIAWDAWAISQGHWFFDRDQMVGIIGPFSIPLEEYLFFVIIPVATVLTWEGVNRFVEEWLPRFKK